jgi:hypothetical protein
MPTAEDPPESATTGWLPRFTTEELTLKAVGVPEFEVPRFLA